MGMALPGLKTEETMRHGTTRVKDRGDYAGMALPGLK